ncbi:hypothetical protein IAD21_00889 [Abditibacteriota bacterium]|nr:hypothetical protein IAD21_00889 [Abditibacteriota bacterium]
MPVTIPTPVPSNATTHSNGVAVGGRLSVALEELKRRLDLNSAFPGYLASENTLQGFTGPRAMQMFNDVQIVPSDLTKEHVGMLLIGGGPLDFESQGTPAFRATGTVTFYLINRPWVSQEQYLSALDRQNALQLFLHNYLNQVYDPQGRQVWKTLAPRNASDLPEKWRAYAGVALNYLITQPAGTNRWIVL